MLCLSPDLTLTGSQQLDQHRRMETKDLGQRHKVDGKKLR
ncbi:hypothetical protein OSCI_2440013 [Kamptonema sp. PCC 6506]|nr:hypothetical protein OSCI_2440013 [Kamptonema sp. PCC 6506]